MCVAQSVQPQALLLSQCVAYHLANALKCSELGAPPEVAVVRDWNQAVVEGRRIKSQPRPPGESKFVDLLWFKPSEPFTFVLSFDASASLTSDGVLTTPARQLLPGGRGSALSSGHQSLVTRYISSKAA